MNYNKSQQEAILHKDGPMLVLAGPGSGKTAVITQRTYNLIKQYQVRSEEILVITFTKAASIEMKERFHRIIGQKNINVTFGTFHAVFFAILKHAYGFGVSNIITSEQKYGIMRNIISRYNIEYKDESEFLEGIFSEISNVKNNRIEIEHFYSAQCGEEIFRKIYWEYEKKRKENRLIDFDDMLTYTYELFRERPDILAAWQKKYKYILIDEFQDINAIQFSIVQMLSLPENNLFIVGDDDQSIYRFRGSKPEIMLNFESVYPNAKIILLNTNYRCGKYIVETACNLISYNEKRFQKEIVADSEDCTPVEYIYFENRRDENLYLIRKIKELLQKGGELSQIAVLYRTNTQPQQLIEMLMEYNLPIKVKDSITNIYEHWIAKDLLTYMRLASGEMYRVDFLRVMNRPTRYIRRDDLQEEKVDIGKLREQYIHKTWMLERLEKMEYDLALVKKMNPYGAINYIRKGIGYDDFICDFAKQRGINKEELLDLLEEIQGSAKGYRTYAEWKKHIEEYGEEIKKLVKRKEQEEEAITLATLHSSKGLEFDAVFIIDVNEGIMPYKKAVMEEEIEEERRLFYVGMTRARKKLSLYSVGAINEKEVTLSRFVEETKQKKEQE